MSFNNVMPAWAIGNPYGPIPFDYQTQSSGKYFYLCEDLWREGPFDSLEEARQHKETHGK